MNNEKQLAKKTLEKQIEKREKQSGKVPVRKSATGAGEHYKVKDRR